MGENGAPIILTQNEYMRRMKEMAALQPGMNFYGEMPDSYSVIVNTENPIVKRVADEASKALTDKVAPMMEQVNANNEKITELRKSATDNGGKTTAEDDKQIADLQKANDGKREEQTAVITDYAKNQPLVGQLIDLALLGNGMLRGAQLSAFISRSLELLK